MFGIYDNNSHMMVCDPIPYDQPRFSSIIARYGIAASLPVQLDGAVHLGPLSILPARTEFIEPPAPAGYEGVMEWVVDDDELVHRMKWQPGAFAYVTADVQRYITQSADHALGVLERGYTEREIKTWSQQRTEAEAWSADNSVSVPLLQGLADRRGVELSEVVAKVQAKVQVAATLTGVVLGDAQAAADKIAALLALDADPEAELPADWFDQLQEIAANWRKDWPPELQSAIEN